MKYNVAIVTILFAIIIAMMTDRVTTMPRGRCNPDVVDKLRPRICKVCAARSTAYRLSSADKNYINDKVPVMQQKLAQNKSPVKPQPTGHRFLRFGRRR